MLHFLDANSDILFPSRLTTTYPLSYTTGMKTAISLPDLIFREAERFARRFKKSRSQLYVDALTEYLERHAPDSITEAMNKVLEKVSDGETQFSNAASARVLREEQW
jgi:antitoxin MazE6